MQIMGANHILLRLSRIIRITALPIYTHHGGIKQYVEHNKTKFFLCLHTYKSSSITSPIL